MGLFTKSPKPEPLPWVEITSTDQLNELLHNVGDKPIMLFKHSTRCNISGMALNSLQRNWTSGKELCDLYFIDLLKHRDVSNLIVELTGVVHQSPQAIVIRGNEIIYDESHNSIDARRIESLLRKA